MLIARVSALPQKSSEEAKEPDIPSELVAEPVVAYRVWDINNTDRITFDPEQLRELARAWDEDEENPLRGMSTPWLEGIGVDSQWRRPEMHAMCTPPNPNLPRHEDAPQQECNCGIWALKDEGNISSVLAHYQRESCAWGTVLLWGKIIETELGYRGEYAQPLSISVYGISNEEAIELAEAYECEVQLVYELPISGEAQDQQLAHIAAAQAMAQKITFLSKHMQSSAAASLAHANTLAQFQNALLMQVQKPKPSLLSRIFGSWFFVGLATINFTFFVLDRSWMDLVVGGMCSFIAMVKFKHSRRLAKLLIGGIPFFICLMGWMLMMFGAIFIDFVFLHERKNLWGSGPAEAWVDNHDPVRRLDKWITS